MCGVEQAIQHLSPFEQRLLAEAVRCGEDRLGRVADEAAADDAGRQAGGSLEQRIVARALAMPHAPALARSLIRQIRMLRWLVIAALVLALVAGMVAARFTLGTGGPVNILFALGGLLGVQLVLLVLWAIIMFVPVSRNPRSHGSLLGLGLMKINRWLGDQRGGPDLVQAMGQVLGHGAIGRWLFSSIGHGIWFWYTLGALAACVWLLAIHQYDFFWATTILPGATLVDLLTGLAWLPALLGFPVPAPDVIASSRLGLSAGLAREQWSGLLVGALIVYGLLPRGLLAVYCRWRARRAAGHFRLNPGLPGYARLVPRLQTSIRSLGRHGAPPHDEPLAQIAPVEPLEIDGLIAVVGVELDDDDHWPPLVAGMDWAVLGRADDRHSQRDILAILASLPMPPALLVTVVTLRRTPDRGVVAFLHKLVDVAPVMLVLHGAGRVQRGGGQSEVREAAWRAQANQAGIGCIEAFDLDLPEDCEKLQRRLGYG